MEEDNSPTSFILTRGDIGKCTKKLMHNIRKVMSPNTSMKLKSAKRDKMKHLMNAALSLNVSHMIILSMTKEYVKMRMFRTTKGPTLDFEITKYTLTKDISKFSTNEKIKKTFYQFPPILLMNNFNELIPHEKHIVQMFRSLFPSLNLNKAKISRIRRVVLVNKLPDSDEIEFRHFGILIYPGNVSMGLRDLFRYNVPDMHSLNDISDYIFADSRQNLESVNASADQNSDQSGTASVRLFEIGPRFTMKLAKIYEGIGDKEVLYHSRVQKTESEKDELRKRHSDKEKLKNERKIQQEANVAAKKEKLTKKIMKNKMRLNQYQEKIKAKYPEKTE